MRAHSGLQAQHASGAQRPGADFWGGPGGKGGGRIQNQFNIQISIRLQLGFDTRCTPGGVRRIKMATKITKMATKIHPKSMKNPGCVAVTFLDCFLGCKGRVRDIFAGPILAAIFDQNPEKDIKKTYKNRCRKNIEN